jgi:hypothetical protein
MKGTGEWTEYSRALTEYNRVLRETKKEFMEEALSRDLKYL